MQEPRSRMLCAASLTAALKTSPSTALPCCPRTRQEGGSDIHFVQLEVSDLSSVHSAAEALKAAEPDGFHGLLLDTGVMACPLL